VLIEHYDLEIFTPPCEPGAERHTAVAHLVTDIAEALPLLNATLPGAVYHRTADALIWKTGERSVAFHAHKIALSNVADRDSAHAAIVQMVDLVNQTWERRGEIAPDYSIRQRPKHLAIYKLLPQTNCKRCGEPTCYTFAAKIAAGHKSLEDCPPLLEAEYAGRLAALQAIVA
jgi:ArsR family metal-binding transcriptional regulator